MIKKFRLLTILLLGSSLLLCGCSSNIQVISPKPPAKYKKLGKVYGSSSGSLGIGLPGYYFIPMGLNSRIQRAYEDALSKAPGATGLINVTYSESWFWWVIGTGRTVKISGEAIREIR